MRVLLDAALMRVLLDAALMRVLIPARYIAGPYSPSSPIGVSPGLLVCRPRVTALVPAALFRLGERFVPPPVSMARFDAPACCASAGPGSERGLQVGRPAIIRGNKGPQYRGINKDPQ